MLWAYLSFSQFLIIWSANLPEEIPHYLDSLAERLAVHQHVLIVGCTSSALRAAAVARPQARHHAGCASSRPGSSCVRLVDYYWHVAPEFHTRRAVSLGLLDVALPLALGGIFISLFVSQLRPLVAAASTTPGLEKALTSPCPLST